MRGLVSDLLACMHHDSYLKSSRPALRSWGGARHGRSVGITSQPALVVTRVGTPTGSSGRIHPWRVWIAPWKPCLRARQPTRDARDRTLDALPQTAPKNRRRPRSKTLAVRRNLTEGASCFSPFTMGVTYSLSLQLLAVLPRACQEPVKGG